MLTETYYLPRVTADLIEVLEDGAIDRKSVPNCKVTAIGLETEANIGCQRTCSVLGLYVAVNARNSGYPTGTALAPACGRALCFLLMWPG